MIISFSECISIGGGYVKITVFKEYGRDSVHTNCVKLEFETMNGQFSTVMSESLFRRFVKCAELLFKLLHDIEVTHKKDTNDIAKLGHSCE